MSAPKLPPAAALPDAGPAAPPATATIAWDDPARQAAFVAWLESVATRHGLVPSTLRMASADASFRRYFRLDTTAGDSRIVMDAPPAHENSEPFVRIAALLQGAGLRVPEVLAWDAPQGFLLLTDLGRRTMMDVIDRDHPAANLPLYARATDALLTLQQASRPGVLPAYDEALLRRELALFPDWYLARHRGVAVEGRIAETLARTFDLIVARNLAAPSVYVHRDFMPRNLMAPTLPAARGSLPPEGALAALGRPGGGSGMTPTLPAARGSLPPEGALAALGRPGGGSGMAPTLPAARGSLPPEGALPFSEPADDPRLGVLDFQDAVYGPVTYDIASLMRDAFLSWEEDFVLDVTIRYWEKARKAGLMDFEDWHSDFGAFWRAVEWMGLQRHLKVAGIFARLTLRDGKPKYLADTPRFMAYIRATAARYRELTPLLRLVDEVEGLQAASGWAYGRV